MSVRTNVATNPAAEHATTPLNGWASANATIYPVTADVDTPIGGGLSPMTTRLAASPSTTVGAFQLTGMIASGSWIPISNGVAISVSLDIRTELADRLVRVSLNQYTSAGVFIAATPILVPIASTQAFATERISVRITPDQATAARGYLIVTVISNQDVAVEGERVWVDNLLIENAAASDGIYFDGDSLDDPTVTYAWTGTAKASTSTRTDIVSPGLTLDWVPSRGAVRFTITNPLPGQTVKRVRPGQTLGAIRGYGSDAWWKGFTEAYGFDYEMPLGVTVTYVVVAANASGAPVSAPTASIFTMTPGAANGEAWLRDPLQPTLSMPVSFLDSGDELRAARQTVLEIAGRKNPYIVWDTRLSRAGTVILGVRNAPVTGVWTYPTNRQQIEKLFDSGRPLLLSVCHRLGFMSCYMAVGDVRFPRIGKGALWAIEVDYTEIDIPSSTALTPAVEIDYTFAQSLPPGALYEDWAGDDAGIKPSYTYYQIATRRSV